jgi:dihydrolipoamide dehydrogenase
MGKMAETARQKYDMTIIGSGPGGYVAAVRAAQLGMSTAVVEMAPALGGTCLNWGCIPTKAMLQAAETLESARHASKVGIEIAGAELDLTKMHRFKNKTVKIGTKGVEYLFKQNGVELLSGRGRIAGAGRVEVTPAEGEPYTVETTNLILATGSAIQPLPGVVFDGEKIINSDHALHFDRIPSTMIVLGAGAVGVEFASIYRSFGAEVTVVELLPRLIPLEDEDLGAELEKAFKKRGIKSHVGTRVEKVTPEEGSVRLVAEKDGEKVELEAEVLLVAVGRRPMTSDLGLEGTAVKVDERGFIEVDEMMRTAEQGVYAIGDILKTPALAHVASHEGIVAVEHAAGVEPHAIDYDVVPSCTYCQPEVASIGLSEAAARERGLEILTGSFPFAASSKAKILNDTRGFIKIVADKGSDRILGIHIIGAHATELIAEAVAALNLHSTATALFQAMHPHPTLSEAMAEAALGVHGRAIHI